MRRWLTVGALALGVFFFGVCGGQFWLWEVGWRLAAGWALFLLRVLPLVTWRGGALAEGVAVAAVLGVGLHALLGRLWRQVRSAEEARPWPARWTASLVGLLVLLFVATMATVGVGHQVGWLFSREEHWVVSSWAWRREWLEGGPALCEEVREALARDASGAGLTAALLAQPGTRASAERLHVVARRGPEGKVDEVLVFAREAERREREGVVRCLGGDTREPLPARDLPRLLAGEPVAADAAR